MLATVPIGYGDGVSRALTNNADLLVGGRRFPLVGTVSMDNVALDLGADGGGVGRGDEALLIGGGAARRGDGAAPGHDQLRGHVRADGARAARAPPRRGGAVIETLREALAGERAWLVGGALRDRLLGRPTPDLDVVVDGDVRRAARSLGRGAGGASFELSDQFGAWRVVARDRSWQVDITPLQGGSLEADLGARDLTVNAMAEPLAGGELVDPHGGARDLDHKRLRMVSADAFVADPLRTLRVARLATELGFEIDARHRRRGPPARAGAGRHGAGARLHRAAAHRRRRRGGPWARAHGRARAGGRRPARAGDAARSRAEPLPPPRRARAHARGPAGQHRPRARSRAALGDESLAAPVRALLAEPLADELTRGGGLRFGALLHDIAKPQTRTELPDGRIGFPRHDEQGAEMARAALARLRASERLRSHVAALTRHHLRLGFLVHQMPLDRHELYRYLLRPSRSRPTSRC